MARIILIHGAWGNAASWATVVPMLARAGHRVEAVNLPGHGAAAAPDAGIGQKDYVDHVEALLMDGPPALLVGHSMGGVIVAQVAARQPAQVTAAVFVAALLPRDGESLLDLIRQQAVPGVQPHVVPGPIPGTTLLAPGAGEALFPDLPARKAAAAIVGMSPQSNKAQKDKAVVGPGLARVPKAYVFCSDDRVVSPPLQRQMVAATPCEATFTLECGHMPMLSAPQALADILLGLTA